MSGNAQVIDRHITRLDFMRTFYNAQNDLNEVLRNIAIAIFNQNKGVEMYQIIEDLKNQYGEYLVIINAKNKLAFELDCYKIPKKYITDKKFEEECSNIQTIKKTLALNLRHNDDKGLLLKLIDCKRISIYNDYSPKVLITISEVDEVKEKLDNSKDN